MRLGMTCLDLATRADLESHLDEIDRLGIGCIPAPSAMHGWTIDECVAYGDLAEEYGLVVVETFLGGNLLHPDAEVRSRNIAITRETLLRADAMRADTVTTLAGSLAAGDFLEGAIRPHPDNRSDRARDLLREACERILDGLELAHTTYSIEPMPSSFFHEPEEISTFLRGIGHPSLRLHLDQMNMHGLDSYFRSTELIDRTFELLGDLVVAVHAKDLLWNDHAVFIHLDEVLPGEGVLDYPLFVRRLGELPSDCGVMTEHLTTREQFHRALRYIRSVAEAEGVEIVGRGARIG